MERGSSKSEIHYHIRWSDSSIDWMAFATKEEATSAAGEMRKPNETYVIIGCDDDCERCKLFESEAMSRLKVKRR